MFVHYGNAIISDIFKVVKLYRSFYLLYISVKALQKPYVHLNLLVMESTRAQVMVCTYLTILQNSRPLVVLHSYAAAGSG